MGPHISRLRRELFEPTLIGFSQAKLLFITDEMIY
jgi:hypothetical protein